MEFHGFRTGFLIILGGIVASIVLVAAARKMFSKDVLRQGHDITGNLLSVVGTLYAVLLGLVVVDALVRFEQAIDVVQSESNALADIFLLSEKLPELQRDRLKEICKTYAHQVVEQEWPLMERGQMSADARDTAFSLTRALNDFEPTTESQKAVYPMILEQIRELWDFRRERAGTAQFGIPAVEWFVLIVGAAVTVLFAGLFGSQSVGLQRFVTTLTALVIGLNLYLVSLFGYPFSGELTVSSRPFATDIAIFEGRFDDKPAHEQAIGSLSPSQKRDAEAPWPPEVTTAAFASPADGSEQKTLLYLPPGDEPVPLLVAFHTWSGNYLQNEAPYAEWCIARGWAFVHPDLRGPGSRPEAAGSDLAFADLRAVLELAQSRRRIDHERIYAVGVSGGGMMALLAAARMPDVWAAASAWVPVTDLAAWHADSLARKNKYATMIERVCGGPPGAAAAVDAAYTTRSVVARLETARFPFPIDINTGIHDGHTGSVPVSHAIRAFNAVAAAADRIPDTVTDALVKNRRVPADLAFADTDPLYATKPVLLRRQSGPARLTVFDGGHDILHEAALTWLEAQRRGTATTWSPQPHAPPILNRPDPAAGK